MEYERELVVRTAGALPVVAKLADRLGLVEAVDRFCPIRSVADYTHGQVVLALVANRLTHPRPLLHASYRPAPSVVPDSTVSVERRALLEQRQRAGAESRRPSSSNPPSVSSAGGPRPLA